MTGKAKKSERVFKTAWFARAARKAHIEDTELCEAFREVLKGQSDALGGGVYKKRLNKNQHRSIIVGKGKKLWIYVYLFAKKDRDNIDDKELAAFRELADLYAKKSAKDIERELEAKVLLEICNEDNEEV